MKFLTKLIITRVLLDPSFTNFEVTRLGEKIVSEYAFFPLCASSLDEVHAVRATGKWNCSFSTVLLYIVLDGIDICDGGRLRSGSRLVQLLRLMVLALINLLRGRKRR
jgi:hypothetical protein